MAAVDSMLEENIETQFFDRLSAVEIEPIDLDRLLNLLMNWRNRLLQQLVQQPLTCKILAEHHSVARNLNEINENIATFDERWGSQWQERQPAQDLARYFDDKLMFLVYGKFNAGKSSFCNFIADRFAAQGHKVSFFVVDGDEIKTIAGPFKEGSTETTAEIQGLLLADRMVLLDTPGLHSLTEDNAALTRQFLESADGMLWLSSSTSPGQVQELDALGQELRRRKPLLPVITRSDFIDEDIVNNEIVKVVCNKTIENRSLQEEDLGARAVQKLAELGVGPEALVPAISVSVYATKEGSIGTIAVDELKNKAHHQADENFKRGGYDPVLDSGGFYRFYEALGNLLPYMVAYKQKKPAEVLLHHLEENIFGDLVNLQKQLQKTCRLIDEEIKSVKQSSEKWARQVWQQCTADVPTLLDDHIDSGCSVQELYAALCIRLNKQISHETSLLFPAYKNVLQESIDLSEIEHALVRFKQVSLDNYETLYECLNQEIFHAANILGERMAEELFESLMGLQEKLVQRQELIQNYSESLDEIRLNLVHSA